MSTERNATASRRRLLHDLLREAACGVLARCPETPRPPLTARVRSGGRVVTVTIAAAGADQGGAPPAWRILSDAEIRIVEKLRAAGRPLLSKQLAPLCGAEAGSTFRTRLRSMEDRGILTHDDSGYRVNESADA